MKLKKWQPIAALALSLFSLSSIDAYWSWEIGATGGTGIILDKEMSATVEKVGTNLSSYANSVAKAGGLTGNFYVNEESMNKVILPIIFNGELRFFNNDKFGFGLGGGYQFGAKPRREIKSGLYQDVLTVSYDTSRLRFIGMLYYRFDFGKMGIGNFFLNTGLGAGYYRGTIAYKLEDTGNFLTGNHSDTFRSSALGYQGLIEIQTAAAGSRFSFGVEFTYGALKNWKSDTAYLINAEGKPLESSLMQVNFYVGYTYAVSGAVPGSAKNRDRERRE